MQGQTDVEPLEPALHDGVPVHQGVGYEVVVVRLVQEHSVVQNAVKNKHQGVSDHVSLQLLGEGEGVAKEHRGQC